MSNVVNMEDAAERGANQDFDKAKELIAEIEENQAKIDAIAEEEKVRKAPFRDNMAALKKQAKEDCGIEAKALSLKLAERKNERRLKARIEALSEAQASQYGQLKMDI